MGMFDSVYTELTCPFCGYQYKYTPPSYADAKKYLDKSRASLEEAYKEPKDKFGYMLDFGGLTDEECLALIDKSNSEDDIQNYIASRYWGLAEVQTKDWDCVLATYYVGDLVDYARYGHYFIPSMILCGDCCYTDERQYKHQPYRSVSVWIEMDNHTIRAVLTKNPETGEPERETW